MLFLVLSLLLNDKEGAHATRMRVAQSIFERQGPTGVRVSSVFHDRSALLRPAGM